MSYAEVNMFCIEQLNKALQYLMHICQAKCAVAALVYCKLDISRPRAFGVSRCNITLSVPFCCVRDDNGLHLYLHIQGHQQWVKVGMST